MSQRSFVLSSFLLLSCASQAPRPLTKLSEPIPVPPPSSEPAPAHADEDPTSDDSTRVERAASSSNTQPHDVSPALEDEAPYPPRRGSALGTSVAASSDNDKLQAWNRGGLSPSPLDVETASGKVHAFHAAPRIRVDVRSPNSHREVGEMQRVARSKGYWPIRLCYEDGLRKKDNLHGDLSLTVSVSRAGATQSAKILSTHIEDHDVVACIAKAAKSIAWNKPERGADKLLVDVSLWPGDKPVRAAGGGSTRLPGGTDPELLRTALHERRVDVQRCYAEGLARHPGLWGRLAAEVQLEGATVTEVREVESNFPDPEVTKCVLESYRGKSIAGDWPDRLTFVHAWRLTSSP